MSVNLRKIIEKVKEPILAILAALLISSFIVSHTKIPTESMMPTINPGDHLLVNRMSYFYSDPKRGEIAVFIYDNDYLIKRIIGIPGDVIDVIENEVYINGELLDESAYLQEGIKTFLYSDSLIDYPYEIPKNYYFVMGDNRRNSKDSRMFGPIPRESIVAKAGYRIFPLQEIGLIE